MSRLKDAVRAEHRREADRIHAQAYQLMPHARGPLVEGISTAVALANAEHLAAQLRAAAITIQPRRTVTETEPGIYTVSDSSFVTTDRTLAESVATELDRIEPLPASQA